MIEVLIEIGNSDDRLSQAEWSAFHTHVDARIASAADAVYFAGSSNTTRPWQNSAWHILISEDGARDLRTRLENMRIRFKQDSIAWAVCAPDHIEG